MALPLATTVVTVSRSELADPDTDPTDATYPSPSPVITGLRASIGTPSAAANDQGGTRVVYTASILTDPADLQPRDLIVDADGNSWVLLWARASGALGLHVMQGRLELVTGAD